MISISFAYSLMDFRHSPLCYIEVFLLHLLSKSDWRDTNERESGRYYLEIISDVYTYTKKRILESVPLI